MSKILNIVTGQDNPTLRTICETVKTPDKTLIKKMIATLNASENNVGLAAPQVGVCTRMFVMKFFLDDNYERFRTIIVINPEILEESEETCTEEEGCLSLPEIFRKIMRPYAITVSFLDEKMQKKTLFLEGYNARIFQHESDHLEGVLFIDRI